MILFCRFDGEINIVNKFILGLDIEWVRHSSKDHS